MSLDLSQAANSLLARRQRQREIQQNGAARSYSTPAAPRQSRPRPTQPPSRPPKHLVSQPYRAAGTPSVRPPAMPPPKHLINQQRSRVPHPPSGPPPREPWRAEEPKLRPRPKPASRIPRTAAPPAPPAGRPAASRMPGSKVPRQSSWANEVDTHARPSSTKRRPWQPQSNGTVSGALTASALFPKDAFLQISLGDELETPEFLEGFAAEGLAMSFEGKKANLCAQVDEILGRYFEDEEQSIKYSEGNNQVDDSYERFPEVGAALRDHAPDLAECFCIAKSDFHQAWAVGVSEKGRNRYQASRIALAAILVSQSLDANEDVDLSTAPAFESLINAWRSAGIEEVTSPQPVKKKRKVSANVSASRTQESEAVELPETSAETVGSILPRDVPFIISFDDESMPSVLDGLPSQAIAVSSDGKKKGLYSNAESLLSHIAGEESSHFEYHDDPNWAAFPEVGALLKKIADVEECFCIAISRAHDVWALGVGMKSQSRYSASKIALATALAMSAQDSGDPVDFSEFAQFDDFVQEAYSALSTPDDLP